jgi:tetratricopeptide (TPR) repeat protein/CHAT domain-containing protein
MCGFAACRLWGVVCCACLLAVPAAADRNANLQEMTSLLEQIRPLLRENRRAQAEPLAKRYVTLAESTLAGQPKLLADNIKLLADLERDLKHYAPAELLYQRVVSLRERALGAEHLDVARALFALANVRSRQGQYAKAEAPYMRVLAIWEQAKGPDYIEVANAAYNLANNHLRQSHSAQAEPLFLRAMAIYEKVRGPNHGDVVDCCDKLADLYLEQLQFDKAEPLLRRSLAIEVALHGPAHFNVAVSLSRLGNLCQDQGRYAEAQQLHQRMLELYEKLKGPDSLTTAKGLMRLADDFLPQGAFGQADAVLRRALEIRQKALASDDPDVAETLYELAWLRHQQGRFAEAETLHKQALAIREKTEGAKSLRVSDSLTELGRTYAAQARFTEAEAAFRRVLTIREQALGPEHLGVAPALQGLAHVYHQRGRYAAAESLFKRALAIRERTEGPEHSNLGYVLNDLANVYYDLGRLAEAEALHRRALAIREKNLGPENRDTAGSLHNLGRVYHLRGRYAEAEALFKQALPIWEKTLGVEHPDFATTLSGVAVLYSDQNRYAEAEALLRRCLTILEKAVGPNHPDVAYITRDLGQLCVEQQRYTEAEAYFKRALAIREKAFGPEHSYTTHVLCCLGGLYREQSRYAEAETLLRRVVASTEKSLGSQHPSVAQPLYDLACLYDDQHRSAEAEPLVDRAIGILERQQMEPDLQVRCYRLRAELGWKAKRRGEALADLRRAMDLAEQLRGQSSGTAHERAQFFGHFSDVFEQMVAWQVELDDPGEVLMAIERTRARSLLDDLNLSGTDLNIGRSAVERERLRHHENDLRTRIASLERQLTEAKQPSDREALRKKLIVDREALYQYYRDQRSTSPVYRNLLAVGAGPIRISRLQQLVAPDGLLLIYLLGKEHGYVMAIRPDGAKVLALNVDAVAAKTLGIRTGPLTAEQLRGVLFNAKGSGVLQQLVSREHALDATPKLAALWHLLVPECHRQALTSGKLSRLVLVPDGPLAMLPFETLVVRAGEDPKYLLDQGPPIVYGPSATVIWNLTERRKTAITGQRKPVLTVADPAYPAARPKTPRGEGTLGPMSTESRYAIAGGQLARLPYTATESTWLVESFGKYGMAAEQLVGPQATKAKVCREIHDRQVVHLACHGLADQSYGNFFGALALTPGMQANTTPTDDGFLTLAEIYELNLQGCELAILSACETNYGPQQQGEGVWALSRGFLVAGARRVVASNWLVDDEAAACLVSYFSAGVAQSEKARGQAEYGRALHEAKRWTRQQDKWRSPYYWGTFVLVGPN